PIVGEARALHRATGRGVAPTRPPSRGSDALWDQVEPPRWLDTAYTRSRYRQPCRMAGENPHLCVQLSARGEDFSGNFRVASLRRWPTCHCGITVGRGAHFWGWLACLCFVRIGCLRSTDQLAENSLRDCHLVHGQRPGRVEGDTQAGECFEKQSGALADCFLCRFAAWG